jgi:hypothetical protein
MRSLSSVNRGIGILVVAVFFTIPTNALAVVKFVSGLVPDWNQPYRYVTPNGPGPDPNRPNPPNIFAPTDQWNAWCAPSSAANLAGYWTDVRGMPLADTTAYPNSTVAWGAGASWDDYLAESNRPAPQVATGPLPSTTTDIGWYMDTNRGILWDNNLGVMGGYFFAGDAVHPGTLLKRIDVGLQNFLNSRYSLSGSIYWRAGTRGVGYFAGVNPSGVPNIAIYPNEATAFAEVKAEIDTNRTLILCFRHWNLVKSNYGIPQTGALTNEFAFGYTNYTFGTSYSGMPNDENEYWNLYDNDMTLGHAVTCVGYISAGDPADRGPQLGLGATDWVIVHDNWFNTPRNVAVPYGSVGQFSAAFVANTTAVPWPTQAKFVKGSVPDWNQPYQYTVQTANGGPGPDPAAGAVNQWNAWCVPTSVANLAGHWTDYHAAPVADSTAFDGSTVWWANGPSWQDYLADFSRPVNPQDAPGALPAPPTDIGWYMDTNRGVPCDFGPCGTMGGFFFGNPPHTGTYVKDIHLGLANYLNSLYSSGSANNASGCWVTGTEGIGFAVGLNPTGGVAQIHSNEASAFNEVKFEINRNHTLILSFWNWGIVTTAVSDVTFDGVNTESAMGGSYFNWSTTSYVGITNAEDEYWNHENSGDNLGHAVTAVGYIPANDVLDAGPSLGIGPTDWVIVHDNWATTPRNVIVPFGWVPLPGGIFSVPWVANTIAYPDTNFLQITGISVANSTNMVISLSGIPGSLHDLQWKNEMTNTWSTAISNCPFAVWPMQITNTITASVSNRFYRVKASY